MKRRAIAFLLLGIGSMGGGVPRTTPPLGIRAKDAGFAAFTHARLIVSPDRQIEDGTLIVRDGRVVEVGPRLAVPPGALEHDVRGRTIFPGFVDPCTEYGLAAVGRLNPEEPDRGPPKYEGTRKGGNAWNDAVHADRDWVDAFQPDREAAEVFLKRGVTVVQAAKPDGIFRGRGFVTTTGTGLPGDLVLRPRSLHFASFDKGTSQQSYPTSLMGSIALIRQTLLDADWYARAHAAHARNREQELPEFNRAVEALAANRAPFVFETTDELSLLRAARIAEEFSLPFVHVGSNQEYERIAEIAALDSLIILPVTFPRAPDVATVDDQLDVSLAALRHWERAPHNAGVLERAGVRFAFTGRGLDAKHEDFLKNVRKTVRRGLTRATALAALTVVPAEIAGVADEVGTLEAGRRAHFFVSDGDVLTEPAEILSVWIDGKPVLENHALDQVDFRGTYELGLDRRAYVLSVQGKLAAPRGKLEAAADKAKLEGFEVGRSKLTFHADMRPLGIDGSVRFQLVAAGEGFTGSAWLPDGGRADLQVRRTAARAPDEENGTDGKHEESEKESPAALALASRLTFPNVAFGVERPPEPEDVLVRDATIWTSGPQGVLEDADLLVVGGKVAAIGPDLAPGKARVIDARGRHVTPGIIDEHSHLAISRGVNEGSHSVTAEVRIGDVVDSDDIGIYRALAGGVTTAQLLHGSANSIGGQAQVIKLRWGRPPEGLKLQAAPPSIKFALGENVKQSNWGDRVSTRYPQTRMGVETIIRDSLTAALEYEREWRDHEALAPDARERTVPPRRDLQLETLLDVVRSRRFVHCHSYVQAEILMLMRLAEEFGFRVQTFTHVLEGYKVAAEMAAHGAGASSFSDWWAYKFEVYDAIPYNVCLLHDRGVVTSVNSDSDEVVRRLNQEAGKAVLYCGLAEAEALKLATVNPAIQLKIEDRVGSLEPGKDADFVIWDGPPLSMYSKVVETWIEGVKSFDQAEDAAMRQAVREEKERLVQKILAAPKDGGSKGNDEKPARGWHCEDVEDVWRKASGS